MKPKNLKSLLVKAAVVAFCMTLISCDKDDESVTGIYSECYVDKNDLLFESKKDDVKKLNIKCPGRWEIVNLPEWLSSESTAGYGTAVVELTTRTANLKSDNRRGELLVRFLETDQVTAFVKVEQRGGAVADCEVTPNLVTTLSNGIACDFRYGKNVTKFYCGYIEESESGLMSEEQKINTLHEEFKPLNPNQDEVVDFDGLRAGTRYVIYTLGYDKDGNRGNLVSTPVSTMGKRDEPEAWLSNINISGGYWRWSVEKNAACDSYYMMTSENYYVANFSDVLQAWLLEYAAKEGTITEYANGADWRQKVNGTLLAVWTRGIDKRGVQSGVINWKGATTSSSARAVRGKKSKGNGVGSVRKPLPGEYCLYKVK